MQFRIDHQPSYALLKVRLEKGEVCTAEAAAMVAIRGGIRMETKARGGVMKGLKRAVLGGESFFVNNFIADQTGEVHLAPTLPGDITSHHLANEAMMIQSGSFLADHGNVDLDTKFGGGRSFFAGEGLFLLRAEGSGSVFFSSFGAIDKLELQPGEQIIVDTGHIVAFTEGVEYNVERAGSWKTTLLGRGEGFVVRMKGPGTVWTQSRSSQGFLGWVASRMPGGGSSRGGSGNSILGAFSD